MRWAIGSMPLTALITMAAVSTASSAGSDWPRKSAPPGVSMKWMRQPRWVMCITEAFSECCMRRSITSWSLTVPPRSSAPAAPIAPAACSKASASTVLPAAEGPTSASVRMSAVLTLAGLAPLDGLGMGGSPYGSAPLAHRRRSAWAGVAGWCGIQTKGSPAAAQGPLPAGGHRTRSVRLTATPDSVRPCRPHFAAGRPLPWRPSP